MALKTVQVSSNLASPGGYGGFSPSSPPSYYKPKSLPGLRTADPRISSTKKHHHQTRTGSTSSVLKCRANLHGCTDAIVQSNNDQHATELPVVLCPSSVTFPGATLQLQAFEFRYRIMVQTLLQQQGLISFGVVYCPNTAVAGAGTGMADVGCVVRVIECERLVDGRFFLTCAAGDRFRVLEVVRTRPYVVAKVQVLSDRPASEHDDVGGLVRQVEQHLSNVAMLSEKLNWDRHQHAAAQQLRRVQSAASFSFLVARVFVDDRLEQQALLQTDDTAQRLKREGRYLERRSKYLAAVAAIKDAFQQLSCNEK